MTDSMQVVWIEDADKKADCTKKILEKLPEWFGNEQALGEYVEKVKKYPYWVAVDNDGECIGFEPLITLTEMWDEENPCLIMVKQLV